MFHFCFSIFGDNSGAFWTMMSFFAILSSFVFIIKQIRISNNANMISFIDSMEAKWWSSDFKQARKNVCSSSTKHIEVDHERLLGFFEDFGILYQRGVVDLDLIWEKFSYYIENYWKLLSPNVHKYQKQDRTYFSNFTLLQEKIHRLSKKKTKNIHYVITDEAFEKFKETEIREVASSNERD